MMHAPVINTLLKMYKYIYLSIYIHTPLNIESHHKRHLLPIGMSDALSAVECDSFPTDLFETNVCDAGRRKSSKAFALIPCTPFTICHSHHSHLPFRSVCTLAPRSALSPFIIECAPPPPFTNQQCPNY